MAYDLQVFLPANGKLVAASCNVRRVDGSKDLHCLEPWGRDGDAPDWITQSLSLIHISEPTRLGMISYAVFCLKKKKQTKKTQSTLVIIEKQHQKKQQKNTF